MKRFILGVAVTVMLLTIVTSVSARKWSDKTGKYLAEGEFVELKEDKVCLKNEKGQIITIPLASLSNADLDYLTARHNDAVAAIKKLGGTVEKYGTPAQITVTFNGRQVTDDALVHLHMLENLSVLNLDSNKVTDSGLKHLQRLSKLTLLELGDTQITKAGLEKLKEALPNCKITDKPDKEETIADVIKGGNSVRASVLKTGGRVFSDYKVYRDGKKDGVVFEYVYVKDAVIDRKLLTPALVKRQMRERLSTDPNTKRTLRLGIYTRFIFKSFDGKVLCDVKFTADDLQPKKGGMNKTAKEKLIGKWIGKVEFVETDLSDEEKQQLATIKQLLANLKMEVQFKADGTVNVSRNEGLKAEGFVGKWKVIKENGNTITVRLPNPKDEPAENVLLTFEGDDSFKLAPAIANELPKGMSFRFKRQK